MPADKRLTPFQRARRAMAGITTHDKVGAAERKATGTKAGFIKDGAKKKSRSGMTAAQRLKADVNDTFGF